MLTRRRILTRSLQGASLLALEPAVPGFLARTARAAEPGRDNVLVVLEVTGGNDGLNTVIPYADDLYHKNRPTLRYRKEQVVRLDDRVGLHPSLRPLEKLLHSQRLAVVQGVGYPNPDRSHFESMDIWQSADRRRATNGWLGRTAPQLAGKADLPMIYVGRQRLPLALQGGGAAAISINDKVPYRLDAGGGSAASQRARRKLLEDLAADSGDGGNSLLEFVQRRQVRTYSTLDRLQSVFEEFRLGGRRGDGGLMSFTSLAIKLELVAKLIEKGFGTRVFYVSLDGFDTHSDQAPARGRLLEELATAVSGFYAALDKHGHAERVRLLTFSEFGRRVKENGSKGTDHGAASCLFVAGPGLKQAVVGNHPSLSDLENGDLRHHTDFRRVYASLLAGWLGCDSEVVPGERFEPIPELGS